MKSGLLVIILMLTIVSCGSKKEKIQKPGGEITMSLKIRSTAFEEGEMIPHRYTCTAEDISPPLAWENIPEGTKSFAIICDDPDAPAGTWVHWVIYNIPPGTSSLQENYPAEKRSADRTMQGKNDFGKIGYGGPCPPGGTHRYFFKLYALDTMLPLEPGATKPELLKTMEGHILSQAQLMGKYRK